MRNNKKKKSVPRTVRSKRAKVSDEPLDLENAWASVKFLVNLLCAYEDSENPGAIHDRPGLDLLKAVTQLSVETISSLARDSAQKGELSPLLLELKEEYLAVQSGASRATFLRNARNLLIGFVDMLGPSTRPTDIEKTAEKLYLTAKEISENNGPLEASARQLAKVLGYGYRKLLGDLSKRRSANTPFGSKNSDFDNITVLLERLYGFSKEEVGSLLPKVADGQKLALLKRPNEKDLFYAPLVHIREP